MLVGAAWSLAVGLRNDAWALSVAGHFGLECVSREVGDPGLPGFFSCRFYVCAEAMKNARGNFRTMRLTCPLLLTTCSYFVTHTHILSLTDAPIHAVMVHVRRLKGGV